MPYLRVDEGEIYYRRQGERAPLVFVNDWALSQNYWQAGIQGLSQSFSCVTYDPRGVGSSRSFRPGATYAINRHSEDLHALILSLRAGYVHLVGHGLGALIAGLCLRRHPQDVHTLSLIAAEPESRGEEWLQDRIKHIQSLIILRRLASWPLIRSLVLRRYSIGRLPHHDRKHLLTDFSQLNPRASWEMIETALGGPAYRGFVAAVTETKSPVLLVACGQDKLSSVESARRLFSRLDRGRLVTFHQSGHFPMVESPRQFANVLRDFLTVSLAG